MKTEKYPKNDGSEGESYFPEKGDEYTCLDSEVKTFTYPANVRGKATMLNKHTIRVQTVEGVDLFLVVSEGQKKVLDKESDLTDKKIAFEEYTHKTYGVLLGARVVKESDKKEEVKEEVTEETKTE